MSAHDYCTGHDREASADTTADRRLAECSHCALSADNPTAEQVTLIAALGGGTTMNPNPPQGITIPACAPTEEPDYWRMIEDCDDACHHPVHAFGHPERIRHLIPTSDAMLFAHEPLRTPPTSG